MEPGAGGDDPVSAHAGTESQPSKVATGGRAVQGRDRLPGGNVYRWDPSTLTAPRPARSIAVTGWGQNSSPSSPQP